MSDEPKGRPDEDAADRDADEARRTILARRRRFVAVALTSAGVAASSSSCDKNPLVCLSPVPVQDDAGPSVCLSTEVDPGPPPDAGAGGREEADAGVADDADGGVTEGGDAGADAGDGGSPPPPRVCLRAPAPKPTAPKPCLKFAPPDVDKQKM